MVAGPAAHGDDPPIALDGEHAAEARLARGFGRHQHPVFAARVVRIAAEELGGIAHIHLDFALGGCSVAQLGKPL